MAVALLGFALTATLVILAPGPDSMLVMRNTVRLGLRAGWTTAAGTMSGLLLWAVAAALGISALVEASRIGYDILRFAGAGYLIWLGLVSLGLFRRRKNPHHEQQHDMPDGEPVRWGRTYLNGVLSNLLNPKIGVFFVALLPGFVPAGAPTALFCIALGTWFAVETLAWFGVMAWMVARGVGWLRRSSVQRWLERATGAVLIAFGLRLATESR